MKRRKAINKYRLSNEYTLQKRLERTNKNSLLTAMIGGLDFASKSMGDYTGAFDDITELKPAYNPKKLLNEMEEEQ